MTLQDRAATALDRTHLYAGALSQEPYFYKVRDYLAAWLDGKRMKKSFVRTCCAYLEMVSS